MKRILPLLLIVLFTIGTNFAEASQYTDAVAAFNAKDYTAALATLKSILNDPTVAKSMKVVSHQRLLEYMTADYKTSPSATKKANYIVERDATVALIQTATDVEYKRWCMNFNSIMLLLHSSGITFNSPLPQTVVTSIINGARKQISSGNVANTGFEYNLYHYARLMLKKYPTLITKVEFISLFKGSLPHTLKAKTTSNEVDRWVTRTFKITAKSFNMNNAEIDNSLSSGFISALGGTTNPIIGKGVLSSLSHNFSSLYLYSFKAQNAINAYKRFIRATEGRANIAKIAAAATQVEKGGTLRPFPAPVIASATLAEIAKSPIADFFTPLFTGDYKAAIIAGNNHVINATNEQGAKQWIQATAAAIRCLTQCSNGPALEYIKYQNGTVNVNPLTALLK